MTSQGSDFLRAAVVADADDWHFAVLDEVDDRSHASSISRAHSVDLVHNDKRFREVSGDVKAMRPRLQQANTALVSNVTCVELSDGVVALHGEQPSRGGFADAWVAAKQCGCGVDIATCVPSLVACLYLPLVASQVDVFPLNEPFAQLPHLGALSDHLLQTGRLVLFSP